ncbi:uncharacterized protein LOC116295449 [Actinia tenebrosa]|uniref:Uncharacterized protein LOC116295449 n=1 Tax=Actinia tenebrosa TaxID=6105 RepID=A0A6P8I2N4_ACTTE|nr:uncharacterized protein LOC116295449 [Actinia tenebrosa]XP_031559113.1 uncharacterized protein LOC116295449 [Actinia tenebrosa]XP_031559114.1 uncharacterized protein LOC116295449 [Actinia tenebrosa]XP_031559115.1 uncharacterized protein LOC116295449 [Actinia tenebrosa]
MEVAKRKPRSSKVDDPNFEVDGCDGKLPKRRGRARMSSSLLDRLAPTPGFVDKPSVDVDIGSLARRRTPRMASLNAAAKVNLFFEPASPIAGRSDTHHQSRRMSKGSSDKDYDGGLRNGSTSYDDNLFENDECVLQEISSTSDGYLTFESLATIEKQENIQYISKGKEILVENGRPEGPKIGQKRKLEAADSTSEGTVKRGRKKFDINNMLYEREQQLEMECDTTTDANIKTMVDACIQVDLPRPPQLKHIRVLSVPIKGQIYTQSGSIPFTKSHLIAPGAPPRPPVEHTISKKASTKRTASLNAQAMLNAMMAKDGPLHKMKNASNLLIPHAKNSKSSKENIATKNSQNLVNVPPLRIPKINFAATSTSNFSLGRHRPTGNPVKNIYLKSLNMQLEKLQAERAKDPWKQKRTNGWTYHGEPLDKPYCYMDDKIVIRHYYSGIQRGDEIINVRDSVLLKAGTRRKDQPFVARVSGLWEEHDGPNAGEMMMSVFWYYRPEQTEVGRLPHVHGEMEVMASRHKDDNSVACIVDKCYVLSYPEYCRYRAQNRLFQESRSVPLSPVPPGESTKPGSVPPPNTDPSLVFFCRQIYDHRMGRIIKNPWY